MHFYEEKTHTPAPNPRISLVRSVVITTFSGKDHTIPNEWVVFAMKIVSIFRQLDQNSKIAMIAVFRNAPGFPLSLMEAKILIEDIIAFPEKYASFNQI